MESHLRDRAVVDLDFSVFVDGTDGYSGSDLVLVCKEAAMRPLRRLMQTIEAEEPEDPAKVIMRLEPVDVDDIASALERTRPSASKFSEKYTRFAADFGSI
jgi:katanin p60 ATPase-containing subunit A1|eukprot:COSAG01_NODE_1815_length_9170_cov_35.104509_4_plen_101_part_00